MTDGDEPRTGSADFITTQTSMPTREEVDAAERFLGHPLPDGAGSVEGDSPEESAVRQMLLHPSLFRRLSET